MTFAIAAYSVLTYFSGESGAVGRPFGEVRFFSAIFIRLRSFAPVFLVSPPVARKKRVPSIPALMFVTGLLSAVNRALVNGCHFPSFVNTQPFPKRALRIFFVETRLRRKSSTKE